MFSNVIRPVAITTMVILMSVSSVSMGGPTSASTEKVVLNGRHLKHLGTGLREYLFFDIYTLDAYSESGACEPKSIVYDSEAKMVRLTMRRSVPLGYLWWQIKEAFKKNMQQLQAADLARLKKKISSFLGLFKSDLPEGTIVEISYVPGKGSIVKENGRTLGPPILGRDFQELAWSSFFGGDSYCEKMIIEQCQAMQ